MLKANDTECSSSGATMQNGKNAQVGWRSVLPLHRDRKPLFCGLQPVFRFAQLPTIGCWFLKKFDEIANIEGSIQSPQGQLTCPTIGTIQRWGRNGSPHGKHRRLLYRRHLWKHCHQNQKNSFITSFGPYLTIICQRKSHLNLVVPH